MARTAFCPTCARTVYIEMADSLVCPVCSGPILEAVPETAANEAPKPSSETEGAR
ncbi:MAG: hypothetical protein ACRDKF_10060 [Actinomycetota bacterium]